MNPLALSLGLGLAKGGGASGYTPITTIAAMGDSLTGGSVGVATDTTIARGSYLWPTLAAFSGLESKVTTTGTNFNTGGFTTQQIIDTWLPQVIAAAPSLCVVHAGANSLDDARIFSSNLDTAAAWLFAQDVTIMEALAAAGIKCVYCTMTPDNFPTDTNYPPAPSTYHPDYRLIRKKVNDLRRANCASYGAVVCDWSDEISTSPGDDTALADTDLLTDNIHYNYVGTWKLGEQLRSVIAANFSLPEQKIVPVSGDPSWTTLNPYMTGSVSGLATSWSITTTGTPTPTVTRSKTAEGYQRLSCANGPNPGVQGSWQLSQNVQVTDSSFDGQSFVGYFDFIPQSADFEFWYFYGAIVAQNLDSAALRRSSVPIRPSSAELLKCLKIGPVPGTNRYRIWTAPVTHPGGTSTQRRRVVAELYFYGRGTVDVVACGAIKVP